MKEILSFGFAEVIAKGGAWLLMTLLPLVLTPVEYGVVGIVVALEGLLFGIVLFGQDKFVLRSPPSATTSTSLVSARIVCITGGAILAITLALLMLDVGSLRVKPGTFLLLPVLATAGAIVQVDLASRRVLGDIAGYFLTRTGVATMSAVLVFLICTATGQGAGYIYGALLATSMVALAIIVRAVVNRRSVPSLATSSPPAASFRQALGFGPPFVVHVFNANLLMYSGRYLLGAYHGADAVGVYTFAYGLGGAVAFSYLALSLALEPRIYRAFDGDDSAAARTEGFLFTAIIAGCFLAALIAGLSGWLYELPRYRNLQEGQKVLYVILLAHLFFPVYTASTYVLTAHRRLSSIPLVSALAASVALAAGWIGIPAFGLQGAALATLLGFSTLGLATSIAAIRRERSLAKPLLLSQLALLVAVVFVQSNSNTAPLVFIVLALLLCLAKWRPVMSSIFEQKAT